MALVAGKKGWIGFAVQREKKATHLRRTSQGVFAVATVPNRYKVPVRQWRKWHEIERFIFNDLYGSSLTNQLILLHPQHETISRARWKTVCWNMAWLAADAARAYRKNQVSGMLKVGGDMIDINPRTGKEVRVHKVRAPA